MKSKFPYLQQDLLSSLVVFLVALPLSLGIAIASGVPPAAGMITAIIGGLVAGALAGCPLQVSGPAAGMAVIVFEIVQKYGIQKLGAIVLVAGVLQILAGVLRAGQLFRAISPSVVYGMLAGIGVLIFGAQFHVMVDDKPRQNGLESLLSIPVAVYKGVVPSDDTTHHIAALIGLLTIAILIAWAKYAPRKLRWVPGALVAVVVSTVVTQALALPIRKVQISDNLLSGVEWLSWSTVTGMPAAELLMLGLTVAFVASAETLLSAAAVDQMHQGPRAQYNKELIAQGVGNTLSGLAGALPMTGVIVRSATNVAAGGRTRMATMMHGVWILIFVAALPWVLRLVPTASLAAVLVYTGYKLINVQNIRRLLRYGGAPVAIYAATLIGIVATDLLTGILIGLGLSIAKIIYARTHFQIRVQTNPTLNRNDVYLSGAATFLRLPTLADTLDKLPAENTTYVHFKDLDYVDDACLEVLSNWQRQLGGKGSSVILEWEEALRLYRERNPLGQYQRADMDVAAASH